MADDAAFQFDLRARRIVLVDRPDLADDRFLIRRFDILVALDDFDGDP